MKIQVSFDKVKAERPTGDGVGFADALKPLMEAYSWKPKKGEAILDFLSELAQANRECEVSCDDRCVSCMAVAGRGRRLLLVANLTDAMRPLKLDVGDYRPVSVRLIDQNRTNVTVPMLATLPPLAVLLMTFIAEEDM